MKSFGYNRDAVSGFLSFHHQGRNITLGETDLAITWTESDGVAILQKHGAPEFVLPHLERLRQVDSSVQLLTVPWSTLCDERIGDAVIAEVNRCLDTSGRVIGLEDRLLEITQPVEEDASPAASI